MNENDMLFEPTPTKFLRALATLREILLNSSRSSNWREIKNASSYFFANIFSAQNSSSFPIFCPKFFANIFFSPEPPMNLTDLTVARKAEVRRLRILAKNWGQKIRENQTDRTRGKTGRSIGRLFHPRTPKWFGQINLATIYVEC